MPQAVSDIKQKDGYKTIILDDGPEIVSRTVVITTGVDYRKLEVKGVENFTGAGVYYGAAMTEAAACKDKEVYLIGGGNSAGQGAVYLSKFAKNVYIIIKKDSLSYTMSAYLIQQIENIPNINVLTDTEIVEAQGSNCLEKLTLVNVKTKETGTKQAAALYVFIGAKPYTDWIKLDILKDEKGFIETGRELRRYDNFAKIWKMNRDPFLLETSCQGVFAAGDVRA